MMEIRAKIQRGRRPRRGSALVYALVVAVVMAGLCMALLFTNLGTSRARSQTQTAQRSFYAAEAGLSDAFVQLGAGQLAPQAGAPALLGSPQAPVPFGTTAYWVEVEQLGSRSFALRSTGIDGRSEERLELVLSEAPSGFFQYAAFGSEGVVLDSNAFIDSYDSAAGDYASQVQTGNAFARENGHVGSNADITLKANTEIHGDARPGPTGVLDDSAPNVFVSGTTDPAEELIAMPPIEIPIMPSKGNLVGNGPVVLGPGDVRYDSILMMGGSTLTIRGPARLVAGDFLLKSNTLLRFDASNGPIELYAQRDFVLESNSTVETLSDSALDVTLLLAGDNLTKKPADSLQLGANSAFIGAIYAPKARFRLASNFDVYGSIMCGFLDLSSFGEIHYDEALLYDGWGSTDEVEPVFWHRLPQQ